MKKNNNQTLVSILIFVVIVALDMLTKKMAMGWTIPRSFLGFEFALFSKPEAHAGDPHSVIRVVHYATFLGPLLLVYFFLLSQMVKKATYRYFHPWLTLWVAGLVANVFDRMFYGQVLHWIKGLGVTFNLASIAVTMGIVMCLIQAYKHRGEVFAFYWQRKMKMTHPKFQSFYILNVVAISCFLAISLFVFAYTFMKFYMFQYGIIIPKPMLRMFLIEFGLIVAIFMGILLLMGMYYSSKIAGPLYAFQNYIEKLKNGEDAVFTLREDDELKELEEVAKDIRENWRSKNT